MSGSDPIPGRLEFLVQKESSKLLPQILGKRRPPPAGAALNLPGTFVDFFLRPNPDKPEPKSLIE